MGRVGMNGLVLDTEQVKVASASEVLGFLGNDAFLKSERTVTI